MAFYRIGVHADENFEERFHDGFRLTIDRIVQNGTKYLICCCRGRLHCRGRVIIYPNGDVRTTREHNHPPNHDEYQGYLFKLRLFRAVTTRFDNPRDIYDETALLYPEGALQHPYNVALLACIRRWRQRVRPPTPRTFSELIDFLTSADWRNILTSGDVSMVAVALGEDGNRCVMLYDPRYVRQFENTENIFADGTFGSVPRVDMVVPPINGIRQLYIIMGQKYDCVLPLFYVFMESRSRECYNALFAEVRRAMPHLRPSVIMTDFERAAQSALADQFPNSMLNGCYFHYVHSITKKIANDIPTVIRRNDEVILFLNKVKVLPLLPPDEIIASFHRARASLSPDIAVALDGFIRYFERQWLTNVGPDILSVFNMLRRTNNNCEALNRILRDTMGRHPGLWIFLRNLLRLQVRMKNDLRNLQSRGRARHLPLVQYVISSEVLVHVWQGMETGRINAEEAIQTFIYNSHNLGEVLRQFYLLNIEDPVDGEAAEPVRGLDEPDAVAGAVIQENPRRYNREFPVFPPTNYVYDVICIMCREHESCVVLWPCKHMISCSSCANSLTETTEGEGRALKCPFCRTSVRKAERVQLVVLGGGERDGEMEQDLDVLRPNGAHPGVPRFAVLNQHFVHTCSMCLLRECCILLLPCRHFSMCAICANEFCNNAEASSRKAACPICASPVRAAHRVLMPLL